MELLQLLNEMEIKKEFDTIARIQSGELTYLVKMQRSEIPVLDVNNNEKTIVAVIPEVAISFWSSKKRDLPPRNTKSKGAVDYLKKKARDSINSSFDKMYVQLSPEEVDRFKTNDAMPKILDAMRSYFKKYNPDFVYVKAYKDNLDKREKFYEIVLNKLGYKKETYNEDTKWALYSKDGNSIKEIAGKMKSYLNNKNTEKYPGALGAIKNLASNM
jgi:hypothetical protein